MSRVLVVEDSPTQAAEIAFILEDAGFEAEVAADGRAGLKRLADESFDLVLADVLMPGMSGFQMCRMIKNDAGTKDIPILLLTTLDDVVDIMRGLECGADGYLNKPCEPEVLADSVREAIAKKARRLAGEDPGDGDVVFMGQRFSLRADPVQVLDYLISTFGYFARTQRRVAHDEAQAAESLRRSEERFALASMGANDGLWDWDLKTNEMYFSPRWNEIVGRGGEESRHDPDEWLDRLHPADRERVETELRAHIGGLLPAFTNEHRLRCENGAYRWVRVRGRCVRDAFEKAYRMAGSMTDVHEAKEMEAKLLELSAELQAVLRAFPDLLYLGLDLDGKITDCVGKNTAGLCAQPRDCAGKRVRDLLPNEAAEKWTAAIAAARAAGNPVSMEYTVCGDGGQEWYEARLSELPGGKILAVVRDITKRKQKVAALRESEEKYRGLVEDLSEVTFELDAEGKVTYISPRVEAEAGYAASSVIGRSLLEFIHPDDRALVEKDFIDLLAGKGRASDYRMLSAGGETRWVHSHSCLVERAGKVVGVRGVLLDITERKLAEEALRESEEKYRALVEDLSEVIFEVDAGGIITYISPACERASGYTPAELVGRNLADLICPEDLPMVSENVQNSMSGSTLSVEYRVIIKSGELRWVRSHSRPLRKDGKIAGLHGVMIDITERKRAEIDAQQRAQQQEAVAALGQRALGGLDVATLMDEAVAAVGRGLDVEYARVLELLNGGDAFLLRAGVGWRNGCVGSATVGTEKRSQAGYTLFQSEPVIVSDLGKETRFTGPALLLDHGVVSGMSVVIPGRERPFGVLGAHSTRARDFTQDDANFLQSVANVLAHAIERES